MGMRKQKTGRQATGSGTEERSRIGRDYVEEVQRRAVQLNEAIDTKEKTYSGDDFAEHQRQQIQQHMAQLRNEAVQARRLAEQIHNLSRDGTAQQRKPVMNDISMVDPGHTRRASDKPRASGSQSSFNPLHPSMELPPEQLIRLLGLEGKKTRKHRKPAVSAKEVTPSQPVLPEVAPVKTWTLPDDMVPASRKRATQPTNTGSNSARSKARRAYTDESVFQERRSRLLLPAVAMGALAGIVVSAYLFWGQPSLEQTPTQAVMPSKPPIAAAQIPQGEAVARVAPSASPATSAPIVRNQPGDVSDPKWRAAVAAQEQRVRAAAEERLRERMQAARNNAGKVSSPATPAVAQEPVERVAAPQTSAAPEGLDATAIAIETAPTPVETADSAATDASLPTPPGASTQADMPSWPESASETPEEAAALQPSVDPDATLLDVPEVSEPAPTVENSLAQPAELAESPANVIGNDLQPQPDTLEASDPYASF